MGSGSECQDEGIKKQTLVWSQRKNPDSFSKRTGGKPDNLRAAHPECFDDTGAEPDNAVCPGG